MGPGQGEANAEQRWWWERLLVTNPWFRRGRTFFRHLPSEPRCKLCAAPFDGAAAPLVRLFGKRPWPKNPKYCGSCFKNLENHRGGIEIECSLLFADVRGSTPLAERIGPTAVRELMDRFYDTAAHVLVEHDAIVDKFVGDEVIGIFIPGLAGERHAAAAVAAARSLMEATGNTTNSPWVPIGAGVNTGVAFVGTVGDAPHIELTALGDPVNVAARLASAARVGEILVTDRAAIAAGLGEGLFERRNLDLKGKADPVSVFVVTAP
jgi:adenylate cyclase